MGPEASQYWKAILWTVKWIFEMVSKISLPKKKRTVTLKVEKEEKKTTTVTVTIDLPINITVKSLSVRDIEKLIEVGQKNKVQLISSAVNDVSSL
jgi:hypothetical protein